MNNFKRAQRVQAERAERCGEYGAHANCHDRNTFIVARLAAGWTQEDCAWALGINLRAVGARLAKLKAAA